MDSRGYRKEYGVDCQIARLSTGDDPLIVVSCVCSVEVVLIQFRDFCISYTYAF